MQLYGIVNAFLTNISALAGINDPQLKVSPVGFLRALLENNATTRVTNIAGLQSGQDRTITVRYMNRGLLSQATTIDDCDTPITPAWVSADIGAPYFSKIGMFIADGDLRQYQIEAAQAAQRTRLCAQRIPHRNHCFCNARKQRQRRKLFHNQLKLLV